MSIFIDPDELKSSSKLPGIPDSIDCVGLEALTGADFVISQLPISPVDDLQMHIEDRSIFVQRKSGYDMLSFDMLKSSIARMIKCGIPQNQCCLLFIGQDWEDDDGLFRVTNHKPYGETTYKTFIKLKAKWRSRGGIVDWINKPEQLQQWIEAQLEVIEECDQQPRREIYPKRQTPDFEFDNFLTDTWQEIVEVPSDDWRYFLCAGLDGFGPTTAKNLQEYIQNEQPHLWESGYHALKILSEEDERGKPVHKVKGWGNKSRLKLRNLLALPKGYNLSVTEIGLRDLFHDGWYGALKAFKDLIENGLSGQEAWAALMKQANIFRED
jgi:hypothetical protein